MTYLLAGTSSLIVCREIESWTLEIDLKTHSFLAKHHRKIAATQLRILLIKKFSFSWWQLMLMVWKINYQKFHFDFIQHFTLLEWSRCQRIVFSKPWVKIIAHPRHRLLWHSFSVRIFHAEKLNENLSKDVSHSHAQRFFKLMHLALSVNAFASTPIWIIFIVEDCAIMKLWCARPTASRWTVSS